jgi:exonuclease SbcC
VKFTKLTVAGFGPFRHQQTIDFAPCNQSGLFMVAGHTGSGKTTILDAIAFALYGETTGEGQDSGEADGRAPSELRCTACGPSELTFVELEFAVGSDHYRIRRSPRYERAAKKGKGTTEQPAEATLHRMAQGEWELVPNARPMAEVNTFIQNILGFSAAQFRRVIVVPQGRFREVLVSTSSDRKALLTEIFGTHLYESFTQLVRAHAKTCRKALEDLKIELGACTQGFDWALEKPLESVAEEAEQRLAQASDTFEAAQQRVKHADAALAAATQLRDTAKRDNTLVSKVEAAQLAFDYAKSESAKLEALRIEHNEAERVSAAAAAIGEYEGAVAARDDGLSVLNKLQQEEAPLLQALQQAEAARDEARRAREEGAQERAQRLSDDQQELGALRTRASRIESATKILAGLRTTLRDHETALAKASSAFEAADRRHSELLGQLQHAREQQRLGRAALLAADLRPECECPVCGSRDHPKPASSSNAVPSDADIKAREKDVAAADEQRRKCDAAKTSAEQQRTSTHTEIARIQKDLEELQGSDGQHLTAKIDALNRSIAAIEGIKNQLEQNETLKEREATTAKTAHEAVHSKLMKARGQIAALDENVARREAKQAEEFELLPDLDVQKVKAARRDPQWIARERDRIVAVETELSKAEALRDNALKEAGAATQRDLAPLEAEVSACTTGVADAQKADKDAGFDLMELKKLRDALHTLEQKTADAMKALAPASELDNVIFGKSGEQHISLHAWVLGAYLDKVLSVASARMREMTLGRYELRRTDYQADRRMQAGLSIEVHDSHTGTSRPARTLSGGETFLASLSMALALAEVASERGGRALDTIFIDEGFGSLDSDSLEIAMNVLNRLRDAGRTVGLISHVDEMRRSIPTGIKVVKDAFAGTSRIEQS